MRNSSEPRGFRNRDGRSSVVSIKDPLNMMVVCGLSPSVVVGSPGRESSPVRWGYCEANGAFPGSLERVPLKKASARTSYSPSKFELNECESRLARKLGTERPISLCYRDGLVTADGKLGSVTPIISPPAAFRDMGFQEELQSVKLVAAERKPEFSPLNSNFENVLVRHTQPKQDTCSERPKASRQKQFYVTKNSESNSTECYLNGSKRGERENICGGEWSRPVSKQNSGKNRNVTGSSSSPSSSTSSFSLLSPSSSSKPKFSPSSTTFVRDIEPSYDKRMNSNSEMDRFRKNHNRNAEQLSAGRGETLNMKRSKSFQGCAAEDSYLNETSYSSQGNETGKKVRDRRIGLNVASCGEINAHYSDAEKWENERREFLREAAKEVQIVTDFMNKSRSRAAARNLLYHRYTNRPEKMENCGDLRTDSKLNTEYGVHILGTGKRIAYGNGMRKCNSEDIDGAVLSNLHSGSSSSLSSSVSSSSSVENDDVYDYGCYNGTTRTSSRNREEKKLKSKISEQRKKKYVPSLQNSSIDFKKSIIDRENLSKPLNSILPERSNLRSNPGFYGVNMMPWQDKCHGKKVKNQNGKQIESRSMRNSQENVAFFGTKENKYLTEKIFSSDATYENPADRMPNYGERIGWPTWSEDEHSRGYNSPCRYVKNSENTRENLWRRRRRDYQQQPQQLQQERLGQRRQIGGTPTTEGANESRLDARQRSSSLPKCFRSENKFDNYSFWIRDGYNGRSAGDTPVFEYATKTAACIGNVRSSTEEGLHLSKSSGGKTKDFWMSGDSRTMNFYEPEYSKKLTPTRTKETSGISGAALHRFKKIVLTKFKGKGNEINSIHNVESKYSDENFYGGQIDSESGKHKNQSPLSPKYGSLIRRSNRRKKKLKSSKDETNGVRGGSLDFESDGLEDEADQNAKVSRPFKRETKKENGVKTSQMKSANTRGSETHFSDDDYYMTFSPKKETLVKFQSLIDLDRSEQVSRFDEFKSGTKMASLLWRSLSDPGISTTECATTKSPTTGQIKSVTSTEDEEDCEKYSLGDEETLFSNFSTINPIYRQGENVLEESKVEGRLFAEALWNHVAVKPNELFLRAGNVVEVIDRTNRNWWWGRVGNESGFFPSTCVRLLINLRDKTKKASVASDKRYLSCDESRQTGSVPALTQQEVRSNVVRELLNTERDYVNGLKNIVEGYIERCRRRTDMFNESQINSIFSNLEDVLRFQMNFLRDLESRVNIEHPYMSCIGKTFIIHKSGFHVYSEYCNSHPIAMATLQTLYNQNNYKKFFQDCETSGDFMKIPLDGYLLTPVQRICKYPLQLAELLKHTESDHPDHETVREALETMKKVATMINERKRKMENLEKLFSWQCQVEAWEGQDLTVRSSQLIYQGEVVKGSAGVWTSNLTLFLFDHQLIYCKKDLIKRNVYVYKGRVLLDDANVIDISDGKNLLLGGTVKHGIYIVNHDRSDENWFVFCCRSENEKLKWLTAFSEERKFVAEDVQSGLELSPAARNFAKMAAESLKTHQSKPKKKIFK